MPVGRRSGSPTTGSTGQRGSWRMRTRSQAARSDNGWRSCWPRSGMARRPSAPSSRPWRTSSRSAPATGPACSTATMSRGCPGPTTSWSTSSAPSAITTVAPADASVPQQEPWFEVRSEPSPRLPRASTSSASTSYAIPTWNAGPPCATPSTSARRRDANKAASVRTRRPTWPRSNRSCSSRVCHPRKKAPDSG